MTPATPPRTWDEFVEGLWRQNPVLVMVLGMCPTLAVTVSATNALSMGLATAVVLVASCGLVSAMRRLVPKEVRIATYIVIIATFVTAVDYANTAKLMLRKLWITLRTDLRAYKINFNPPEDIWRRYYVAWDIIE